MSSKRILIYGIVALCLLGSSIVAGRRHCCTQKPSPRPPATSPPTSPSPISTARSSRSRTTRARSFCSISGRPGALPAAPRFPTSSRCSNKYGPQGFQVIGISMDDDAKPVREFYQEYKMNYPVAVGDDKLAESFGGVLGLPVNFIIDRDGRIVAQVSGRNRRSVFDKEVGDLLTARKWRFCKRNRLGVTSVLRWRQPAAACNLELASQLQSSYARLALDHSVHGRLPGPDAVAAAQARRADVTQRFLFRRVSTD